MDLSGNSVFIRGQLLHPAVLKIAFSFNIKGMKKESSKCLKRVCALAIAEYFHNTHVPDQVISLFSSSLYLESQDKALVEHEMDSVFSSYRNTINRGYIVGSPIFNIESLQRPEVCINHLIPMVSTTGKAVTIEYDLRVSISSYKNQIIPRLFELGYILLETSGSSGIVGLRTCERTLSAVKDTVHWDHNDVVDRLKLEFSSVSSEQASKKIIRFNQGDEEEELPKLSGPSLLTKIKTKYIKKN